MRNQELTSFWVATCEAIQHYSDKLDSCYDDEESSFLRNKIDSLQERRKQLEKSLASND